VVVLLFLSVICMNLFWTLSTSLSYENVEKESILIAKDFLKGINITNAIKQNSLLINLYCKNHSEYVFNYQGYTFDIPCSILSEGEGAIIEEGTRDLVRNVYYAEYECDFLNCAKNSQLPLFLVSEKAHDFWKHNLYLSLSVFLVLLLLAFLFVEKKTNLPIIVGVSLILSSLLFIKMDSLLLSISDTIIFKFLGIFFSQTFFISLRLLVAGIALLILGIILKIFKIGFFISKLFRKKQEQKKDKKKKR